MPREKLAPRRQAGRGTLPIREPDTDKDLDAANQELGKRTSTRERLASCMLELLADEAPVEAFERLVSQGKADVVSRDDRRRVEELARRALHVRGMLEERSRRQKELAALYKTAGELSSLHDLERVLKAIVGRARGLLGTDVAYLGSLDDAANLISMKVTEGIASEEFKRMQLKLGEGLGGLVAQKRKAYWTRDYLHDRRFVHSTRVDKLMAEEGLSAVLGVPLRVRNEVIGVLFAASRVAWPVGRDEVALLQSMADHASVALESARLFHETQEAMAELSQANAAVRAKSGSIEQASVVHEKLTSLVLRGGGLVDVATSLAEVLGGNLLVVDPRGRVIATAGCQVDELDAEVVRLGSFPEHSTGARTLRSAFETAQSSRRTIKVDIPGTPIPRWIAPMVAGAEGLGALVLGTPDLSDANVTTLERAALVTALILMHQRSIAETENRLRGELFDDLLNLKNQDADALRRRAALAGIDLEEDHEVVVAHCPEDVFRRADAAAFELATEMRGLSGHHRGNLVLLLPGIDAEGLAGAVEKRLRAAAGAPVTVAVAGPARSAATIAEAYRDARRILRLLLALNREGCTATAQTLGIYGLLAGNSTVPDIEGIITGLLGRVIDYDTKRNSQLLKTLKVYFASGGHLARTADQLHIHVNTLYHRFTRLDELLGHGWREPDRALELHVAIKLYGIGASGALD